METPWEHFFVEKIKKIFTEKKSVIDIGGGLRLMKGKNNRYDASREWIRPHLSNADYKILDLVDTYHPDMVGDIHNLPFPDNSQDAIICIAVLEHVENPILAFREIHRVLKSGGYCFVYVPFLYYYHAEKGYYGDFWRFTEDSLRWLSKPFSSVETMPVRGAIETWIKLSPLGRIRFLHPFWYFLDMMSGKIRTKQVSGYNVFLIK
ncbi:SAM-dependent methyltransferase [Patescibacteria group bacterium]|nr:MAG: SAM-dependent methyltransferase [Patescibacteria group bacterium]